MEHEIVVAYDEPVEPLWRPCRVGCMRGPEWARRAVNWILRMLRAEREISIPTVRTFRAPSGDFLERLHLQRNDMMRLYNQEARTILVGPDAFGEAQASVLRRQRPMGFNIEPMFGGPTGSRILGLEVVMIPWMHGALVVPEWRKDSTDA